MASVTRRCGRRGWLRRVLAAVLVVSSATGVYVTAYLLLLRPVELGMGGHGCYSYERSPAYRLGWGITERLFAPLASADRRIRPTYWRGTVKVESPNLDIPINTGTLLSNPEKPSGISRFSIEAFDRRTGKNAFRFSNWYAEEWDAK